MATPAVQVKSLSGDILANVSPVPKTTGALKEVLQGLLGQPAALQKLVLCSSTRVLADEEALPQESLEVYCIVDETPLWTWSLEGNPSSEQLQVNGARVTCPDMQYDWIAVLTKEPMRSGRHYIEFAMHRIGDEQWCGVVSDPRQAGSDHGGRSIPNAWTYYCGRVGSSRGSLVDGKGALHANGKAVVQFEKPRPSGDVIGMLVDLEAGAIAFDLNGKLQGACAIPKHTPLWVLTVVDTSRDDVELRKPCLDEAPPENLQSLTGALLDISQGQELC